MTEPEPRPPLNGGTVAGGVVLGLLGVPVSLVILALVGLSLGPIGSAIVLLGGLIGWIFAARALLKSNRSRGRGVIWGIAGAGSHIGGCPANLVSPASGAG